MNMNERSTTCGFSSLAFCCDWSISGPVQSDLKNINLLNRARNFVKV